MKHALFAIAGAAAFAVAAPAVAGPGNGHGHGNGHGNGHAHGYNQNGYGSTYGYGRGGCPPGLAKKGCVPPGQARKLNRGQRWQNSYGSVYGYGRIPDSIRQQYDLSNRYRYYYNNGYLYQVDPRTQVVQQVINSILR